MGGGVRTIGAGAAVAIAVAIAALGVGRGGDASAPPTSRSGPARCDQDLNTAAFYEEAELVSQQHHHQVGSPVDFTLEEWAASFTAPAIGLSQAEVVAAVTSDEIYRRHVLQGVLTHVVGPDPWQPMTDEAECARLAAELDQARAAAARFPTVADAINRGYVQGDTYFAGLGVHFQDYRLPPEFDPGRPLQLLYDGATPDARLVGLSYVVRKDGETPPEGFTGANDVWHRHRSFCVDAANRGINLAADVLSPEECAARGGTYVPNEGWWMLHAWVVTGCESDWGIFSSANPRLPYIPADARLVSGCTAGSDVALASASP